MKDSTKESISLLNRIIPNSIPGSSEIRSRFVSPEFGTTRSKYLQGHDGACGGGVRAVERNIKPVR